MSDSIFVNGLALHAYHGVMEHEGRVGQSFIIDLALDVDLARAAATDKLAETASYDEVVKTVTQAFQAQRFRLVEAAAGAVCDALLATYPRISRVRVTVRKPHAPIAATFIDVGVVIDRSRHG